MRLLIPIQMMYVPIEEYRLLIPIKYVGTPIALGDWPFGIAFNQFGQAFIAKYNNDNLWEEISPSSFSYGIRPRTQHNVCGQST